MDTISTPAANATQLAQQFQAQALEPRHDLWKEEEHQNPSVPVQGCPECPCGN